ncbi:MAG: alpha-amylase family glycosyl hydrolase [Treponema sp.]|nr:alpha-amylase family glycosyl hydrolase [Treponema sp.]
MAKWRISLLKIEEFSFNNKKNIIKNFNYALKEFHINREIRESCGLKDSLFSLSGNVVFIDIRGARELAQQLNSRPGIILNPEQTVKAGQLNAMGLIDEILHYMVSLYREQIKTDLFDAAVVRLETSLGADDTGNLLKSFSLQFPPKAVYSGKATVDQYLASSENGDSCRSVSLEELLMLAIANLNPAFKPFRFLFDDSGLAAKTVYPGAVEELKTYLTGLPVFGPEGLNLWDLLRAPALACPDSLAGQLEFMRKKWGLFIGSYLDRMITGLDVVKEEEKPFFGGPGPTQAPDYGWMENEYEAFTPDQDWMPRTVLIAKSTLVWLFQLSRKYGRQINRLDQIPDEELDEFARRGFTGLWLIGIWERSMASQIVKQWTGNPEAAASAYSLYDYDIAAELGGWDALAQLRDRCYRRGIRLGSDMVPNHTGLDSRWVMEHPERFLQLPYPPFPTYTFNGGNLSGREGIGIFLEDHYYNRSDAAVVFKRVNFNTREERYIYHGNDGTSMPWNDTAQIDFLNPEAREAVISTIIGVCKQFSIVRFDAAMTLAKRHIQRLWYPEPGRGGDIASRSEHAVSTEEFNRRIPNEFWREVVDRCAVEAPHTLLLAEAFWMMEGYFVRTLGMHRVYNSAFMNMLKNEENAKYRATIKNTLEFDPEVLKRFVNFMNNPDEETAVAQFGKGDKYFGIATLLVTMPGMPMFGHGQIEGFEEKYGMEYRRSYRDEVPDQHLMDRHEREIFPLLKKRYVFSGSADFTLYDLAGTDGHVNENVFAYSNKSDRNEYALVFYNNCYSHASGWIRRSAVAIPQKDGTFRQDDFYAALGLCAKDRFFTVLREQRSKLWYIRSSKDLAEHGLFVSLSGYEAQVFMDIFETTDREDAAPGSWDARWARLNFELDGRGVPDLNQAVLEIYLRELYAPLEEIFLRENMINFVNGTDRELFIESLKMPVLDFVKAAKKFIMGAENGYPPFDSVNRHDINPKLPPEKEWKDFSVFINDLFLFNDFINPEEEVINQHTAHTRALLVIAPVLGYGLLAMLRDVLGHSTGAEAVKLAEHWKLFGKLELLWAGLGMEKEEAHRIGEIAKAVLVRTKSPDHIVNETPQKPALSGRPAVSGKPGASKRTAAAKTAIDMDKLAAALILENSGEQDFIDLLGINRYDGVTWFNKELFEDVLYWAQRFLIPETANIMGRPGQTTADIRLRAKLIKEFVSCVKKAEAVSDYKLNQLVDVLTQKGKPITGKKNL